MAELSRMDPVKPESAHVTRLTVLRSMRVSPGFIRVTLAGTETRFRKEFTWLGYDHWFRLFLPAADGVDRKSTRLNSSHVAISYAVFCLKKKKSNVNHN